MSGPGAAVLGGTAVLGATAVAGEGLAATGFALGIYLVVALACLVGGALATRRSRRTRA